MRELKLEIKWKHTQPFNYAEFEAFSVNFQRHTNKENGKLSHVSMTLHVQDEDNYAKLLEYCKSHPDVTKVIEGRKPQSTTVRSTLVNTVLSGGALTTEPWDFPVTEYSDTPEEEDEEDYSYDSDEDENDDYD